MMKVNLTPTTYNPNFEYMLQKLNQKLIPFNKVPNRKPMNFVNKAVKCDTIDYDNIERFKLTSSKNRKYLSLSLSIHNFDNIEW